MKVKCPDHGVASHDQKPDRGIVSGIKFPPFARTPPPTGFTLIGALGVNIDSVINFSNHIGELCRKTSQHIGVLIRLKNVLPARAKLQLFKPAILPHLTYCGTAWHFCRASNRPKVERLQEINSLCTVFAL